MNEDKPEHMPNTPPFVRFVCSAIPMVFDDSLSYYEALCALWKYVQGMTDVINNNATLEEEYILKFNELKTFVDTYFENLDVQEEINNKLDQMVEDGTFQSFVDAYFPKKVDYYHVTSETSASDIISYFAVNNAKVIEFDAGTYTLTAPLFLTSNTTVLLNDATLTSNQTGVNIFGYDLDSTYTGYNGVHNVTFLDGKIGTSIALMHNYNIEFRNVEFLATCTTHAVQIASCKDIKFSFCTFDGQVINDSIASSFETIQLESATREGQPYLNDADSVSYDNGGNFGITIEDCEFKSGDGVNNRMYCAIGHHSDDANNHYMNENIQILRNKFGNVFYSILCVLGFKDSVIKGNQFTLTNEVNELYAIRFRFYNSNITIEDNKFVGGYANISSVNVVDVNDGLIIRNNEFTTEFNTNEANIILKNWKNVIIEGNVFGKAKQRNIGISGYGDSTTYADTILIKGNSFNSSNVSDTSARNVYINYADNVTVVDNKLINNNDFTSVYVNPSHAANFAFNNNNYITSQAGNKILDSTANNFNVYGKFSTIYNASNGNYTALNNTALSQPATNFNTLYLELHKSGDAGTLSYVKLKSFNIFDKIATGRSYGLVGVDPDGTALYGKLTINSDGTISYTSASNMTLRRIYGINELVS